MGKFEYTDNELEILRVLKMQEADINKLSAQTDTTEDSIKALKKDIQEEAARRGVDISSAINQQRNIEGVKVSAKDIPSWDELVRRADEEIDYQPIIEDFLTQNEIDFTLQEIQSINDEFAKRTKLNKTDLAFLVIATALQTLRWVIINKICGDLGTKFDANNRLYHNDKQIEDRAYDELVSLISRNINKFSEFSVDAWGRVADNVATINKQVLEQELNKMGFDFGSLKKGWDKMGYIIKNSAGRYIHQTRVNGVKGNYIKIQLPEDTEFKPLKDGESPFEQQKLTL